MQLSIDKDNELTVVTIEGRLDVDTADDAQADLMSVLEGNPNHLLIDLGGLSYISSVGMRVLILAARQLSRDGLTLAVCNTNGHVKRVFEVGGFSSYLSMYDSLAAARDDLLSSAKT